MAIDGRLAGMLELQDQLRDDAPDAVQALRARKMRNVIMLSGDHPEPTRVIAESLGLRHHYAELLPEDKARLVRELKAEGRVVAMVGDGVNDALGLQAADVGMAVPGGAAVAAEAADIVLLSGGLDRVVRALDLARESIVAVRQTLGVAARANLGVVGARVIRLGPSAHEHPLEPRHDGGARPSLTAARGAAPLARPNDVTRMYAERHRADILVSYRGYRGRVPDDGMGGHSMLARLLMRPDRRYVVRGGGSAESVV